MRHLAWHLFSTWITAALCAAVWQPLQAQELVISFGGDVNFARNHQNPEPLSANKGGIHSIESLTDTLREEWRRADINFINVETVVSARNGDRQMGKGFVFRSHPASFDYLIRHGVNAFALANNHAYDHGWPGLRATYRYFKTTDTQRNPLLFAGVGDPETAFAPKIIEKNGLKIAMSALSFGSGRFAPKGDKIGMAYYSVEAHYQKVLDGLKQAKADLKVLSIHYGTENQVQLNQKQQAAYRRALSEAGVHLVLGHHPHVVRGVEVLPETGQAIFYSLGNLLFIGGAAKDNKPVGHDYGMLGKAYFKMEGDRLHLSALDVLPLKGVHLRPYPMSEKRTAATLKYLNGLSRRISGDSAISFAQSGPMFDRGAACFGGPYGARARALCCGAGLSLECDFPDLM